jgi:hypothetical protein
MLIRLQTPHHQPADRKNQQRQQIEPHQAGGERLVFGVEVRHHHVCDEGFGKEAEPRRQRRRDQEGPVGEAREKRPSRFPPVAVEGLGQHGDHRHGHRTTGDEREDHIRKVVRGVEGVELRADPEGPADQDLARKRDDLIGGEEESDEQERTHQA